MKFSPNLSAINKQGETPIHVALSRVMKGDMTQVEIIASNTTIDILLNQTFDAGVLNKTGDTYLHIITKYTYAWTSMLCNCVDKGVNPTIQNADGDTAFHIAIRNRKEIMLSYLTVNWASITNKLGRTVLHEAALVPTCAETFASVLSKSKEVINLADSLGNTAIEYLLETATVEVSKKITMMLINGVDINHLYKQNETLLHLACRTPNSPIERIVGFKQLSSPLSFANW